MGFSLALTAIVRVSSNCFSICSNSSASSVSRRTISARFAATASFSNCASFCNLFCSDSACYGNISIYLMKLAKVAKVGLRFYFKYSVKQYFPFNSSGIYLHFSLQLFKLPQFL